MGSVTGRRKTAGRAFGIGIHSGVAAGPQGGGGCLRCRGGLRQVKSYGGGLWMQSRVSAGTAGEWQRDLQQKCRDQA